MSIIKNDSSFKYIPTENEFLHFFYEGDKVLSAVYQDYYRMDCTMIDLSEFRLELSKHEDVIFQNIDGEPFKVSEDEIIESASGISFNPSSLIEGNLWYKPNKTSIIPILDELVMDEYSDILDYLCLWFNYQESDTEYVSIQIFSKELVLQGHFINKEKQLLPNNNYMKFYLEDTEYLKSLIPKGGKEELLFSYIMREYDKKYKVGKDLQWILG